MSQVSPTATNTTISSTSVVHSVSPTEFLTGLAVRVKEYTREAVEHLILTVFIYCVLCVLLYVGIVRWRVLEFRRDVRSPKKRVLLVIAHPDDECMFFGPTVLNFTGNKNCTLYVMCLSTGEHSLLVMQLFIFKRNRKLVFCYFQQKSTVCLGCFICLVGSMW